jgi:hypothetical protein
MFIEQYLENVGNGDTYHFFFNFSPMHANLHIRDQMGSNTEFYV